jgi:hypothetical protein
VLVELLAMFPRDLHPPAYGARLETKRRDDRRDGTAGRHQNQDLNDDTGRAIAELSHLTLERETTLGHAVPNPL